MMIGDHPIGPGHPAYLIAEIGGNHDGNFARATQLIHEAAEAGADAAKFQFFNPDRLYPGRHTPGSIDIEWLEPLNETCAAQGIHFLCSVFDHETLFGYASISPFAVKIASPEATNHRLVRAAANTGIPLLVSTGALDDNAVDELDLQIAGTDHGGYALLHCVSAYPAPTDELNLNAICAMRDQYGDPIGYSDHSLGSWAAPVAVALGATIVEKHFTDDPTRPGPDHAHSASPAVFARMVRRIRDVEQALGDGVKRVMPSEDPRDRRAA